MLESGEFDPEIWTAFAHTEQQLLESRSKQVSDFNSTTLKYLIKPVALRLQPPYPWDCEPKFRPAQSECLKVSLGSGDNCEVLLSKPSLKQVEVGQTFEEECLDLEVWTSFEHEQKGGPVSFHQSPPNAVLRPVPVCPLHNTQGDSLHCPINITEGESLHNEAKPKKASKKSGKKTPLRSLFRGLRKLFRRKKL